MDIHQPATDPMQRLLERLAAVEQKASRIAITADTGWQTVAAYTNSWVASGFGVQYKRNATGDVVMRGACTSGTANTVAFTLPAGFRPPNRCYFAGTAGGGLTGLVVDTDGTVTINVFSGTNTGEFSCVRYQPSS